MSQTKFLLLRQQDRAQSSDVEVIEEDDALEPEEVPAPRRRATRAIKKEEEASTGAIPPKRSSARQSKSVTKSASPVSDEEGLPAPKRGKSHAAGNNAVKGSAKEYVSSRVLLSLILTSTTTF